MDCGWSRFRSSRRPWQPCYPHLSCGPRSFHRRACSCETLPPGTAAAEAPVALASAGEPKRYQRRSAVVQLDSHSGWKAPRPDDTIGDREQENREKVEDRTGSAFILLTSFSSPPTRNILTFAPRAGSNEVRGGQAEPFAVQSAPVPLRCRIPPPNSRLSNSLFFFHVTAFYPGPTSSAPSAGTRQKIRPLTHPQHWI